MTTTPPGAPIPDPMKMFRDMVGQWEKFANDYGGQMMQRPEAAQAMHGLTSAGVQMQGAVTQAMEKVLTTANMPTRTQVEALGERLLAVEATLSRIEAKLSGGAADPDKPRPTRGRMPPTEPPKA